MRNRLFTLRDTDAALLYTGLLLMAGIRFEVIPKTDCVEIITPFDLAPDDFPRKEWLKK